MIASDTLQAQSVITNAHAKAEGLAPVEDQPIKALFTEITALSIRLNQRADVPRAEQLVLDILRRQGPLTVPQIARQRGTSRQNIQILVDRLAANGRVEFIGNPGHKRSALARLTEAGASWLRTRGSAEKNLLREIGSQLSEDEITAAVSVLSKVRGLLGAPVRNNRGTGRRSVSVKRIRQASPHPLEAEEPEAEEFPISLL